MVLVIRQHNRGNSGVWTGYVTETDFAAAGPVSTPVHEKMQSGESFAPQYQAPTPVGTLSSAGRTSGYSTQPQVQQHQMAPHMMMAPHIVMVPQMAQPLSQISPYPQV